MSRRFLVVVRAGDDSLHRSWLSPSRSYDLFVSCFGRAEPTGDERGDYCECEKGGKWPVLADLFERNHHHFERYDAVWLPDDDLACTSADIDGVFRLLMQYDLDLAQPSLTHDSYFSWDITRHRRDSILRYTNFVEIMAPVLSKRALELLKRTFGESKSGWGLDLVWPELIAGRFGKNRTAILDAIQVKHTRPVGGGSLYGFLGVDPRAEKDFILARYGLPRKFEPKTLGSIRG